MNRISSCLAIAALAACAPAAVGTDAAQELDGGTAVHEPDARSGDAAASDALAPDAPAPDAHGHDAGPDEDAAVYTGPARLSETGLYRDFAARTLADDVIPYSVRFELWADGAEKHRYLQLPSGTAIDPSDIDAWRFPVGTRAWKEFVVGGRPVETRLLEKLAENDWRLIAFVWDDNLADAIAAPEGAADVHQTTHDVPSISSCKKCHRGAADGLIGVGAIQLGAAGIADLTARSFLPALPPGSYAPPGQGVVPDVLGYLHGNCAHCHNDVHPLSRFETLRFTLPVGVMRAEDAPVYRTAIGAPTRHELSGTSTVVVPGQPEASQLFHRARARMSDDQMPPLGTEQPDLAALALIEQWILGL